MIFLSDNKPYRPPLWTIRFLLACLANFSLFSGFYLLLPVLPLYLTDAFQAKISVVGIALSSYTVAALLIRPFSGFAMDFLPRKSLYLLTYLLFILVFPVYLLMHSLSLFILLRIWHGFTFGAVTTAGTTLVIDILPSERRGEGLGYFGVMNNLAMALGPMAGLYIYSHLGYRALFVTAFLLGLSGWMMATGIHAPKRKPVKRPPLSLDRFFLLKGFLSGLVLLGIAIPYGMISSYVALLGNALDMGDRSGLFFVFLAIGLILSRTFSGHRVDQGFVTQMITLGISLVAPSLLVLSQAELIASLSPKAGSFLYLLSAFFLGAGYGTVFPAFNALFVNLAPNHQRGTAVSTYLTSWDLGVGVGIFSGGLIYDKAGISLSFLAGALSSAVAFILFINFAAGHYLRNKHCPDLSENTQQSDS